MPQNYKLYLTKPNFYSKSFQNNLIIIHPFSFLCIPQGRLTEKCTFSENLHKNKVFYLCRRNLLVTFAASMDNIQTLDQLKTKYYGETGTPERDRLENELEALRIGFKIRSARESLNLTQEQLAERVDKKRPFISKIENDGENITLRTLFDIVERGLGGRLKISFEF